MARSSAPINIDLTPRHLSRDRDARTARSARVSFFAKSQILPTAGPGTDPCAFAYLNQMSLRFVFFAACWGCGPSQGTMPSLIPVKGKVTYKGQPLSTGTVHFEPDGYGRVGSGKLQSDGTYVLSTVKDADGVVAGAHKVFITEPDKKLAKDRAFRKYTQPSSSKLTAEVTPDATEFNFDLK